MDKKAYAEYLASPAWRITRNAALKRAGYRCVRCARKRRLQVHHRTYERVGHEHNADLEVLCEDCHSGHHLTDMANGETSRIYLKLASEALREDPFADLADLADIVKRKCVALRIKPYDVPAIDRALALLSAGKRVTGHRKTVHEVRASIEQGAPLSHEEARECLMRLGLNGLVKEVPRSVGSVEIYANIEPDTDEFAYEVFW